MTRINTLASAIALALMSSSVSAQLLITEYVEGTSNNKAIEVTNLSESGINLSEYSVKLAINGADSFGTTISLNDVNLAVGESYVLHHSSASSDIKEVGDQASGSLSFNGDDVVALFDGEELIDSLGQLGVREDFAKDVTLRRDPSVTTGRTDVENEFDLDAQWTTFPTDTFDGLGCSGLEACDGTTPPPNPFVCDTDNLVPIYDVQGDGDRSPLVPEGSFESPEKYFVRGVVTARGESLYKGFYLQDLYGDGNENTSDGVFVFLGGGTAPNDIQPGAEVCVEATVKEYYGNTQLDVRNNAFKVVSTDNPIPVPTAFRVKEGEDLHTALERHEGMQVLLDADSPLVITRNFSFDYASYRNNLMLAHNTPLYNPTHLYAAETEAAKQQAAENANSRVYVESDYKAKDGEVPWFDNFNPVDGYLRMGDKLNGLTAMVGYSYGEYRLVTTNVIGSGDILRLPENDRVDEPLTKDEDGIKVAGFNVLNYFNSYAESGNPNHMCKEVTVNPDDDCYRGAPSVDEFALQQAKLVNAIVAMDADIVTLMELENNGFDDNSALDSLVNALNDEQTDKKDHYQAVKVHKSDLTFKDDSGFEGIEYFGTDAITVGIIYRHDKVKAKNQARKIVMPEQHAPLDGGGVKSAYQRHAMMQTFNIPGEKDDLTVIVNHFKSKGSTCWEDDVIFADEEDVQGSCNNFRVSAAKVLGEAVKDIKGDVLVMGDLNSYGMEDPILTLTSFDEADRGGKIHTASYTTLDGEVFENEGQLVEKGYGLVNLKHKTDFSYSYEGELGSLDHALASPSLVDKVAAVEAWHINAAESNLFEYSRKHTGDLEKSDNIYSSSDHDPIIVTLSYNDTDDKGQGGTGNSGGGASIPLPMLFGLMLVAILRRKQR
ncbi:ExeM/NucH family extracellular endonuclease [Photobacterium sp. BZF1]|uniref:ExeM/NucH family extracellular endonuclease n=1 Tax=Photobacterium sp. BZF1 TaxID=1904457 RepID=UPI001653E0A8|nr:ExeM/NucH family extracellular endonuclease [Photobacterium sp. BZF1]MBC7002295.1 ExeM/NucH family extracellular endonuclease [Photobacterium sp. BZF1]